MASDREIKILIKTVFDRQGTDEAIAAEKKLQELAEKGNRQAQLAAQRLRERAVPSYTDPASIARIRKEEERLLHSEASSDRSAALTEAAERAAIARRAQQTGRQHDAHIRAFQLSGNFDAHVTAFRTHQINQQAAEEARRKQEEPGLGSQAKRALGSALGRFIGVPSLGAAFGIGGAVGVAVGAVQALVTVFQRLVGVVKEWFAEADKMREIERRFQTFSERVEGIALEFSRVRRENELFNQSLGQIKDQVNSVAALVGHLQKISNIQGQYATAIDDALLSLNQANNALQNQFNIIAKIRGEHELVTKQLELRLQREREAEGRQKGILEIEKKVAEDRSKTDKSKVAAYQDSVAVATHEAKILEDQSKTVEQQTRDKDERLAAERKIMQQVAEGRSLPVVTPLQYLYQKGRQFMAGDQVPFFKTLQEAYGVGIEAGLPFVPTGKDAKGKTLARERMQAIDAQKTADQNARDVATSQAEEAQNKAKAAEKSVQFNQSLLLQHQTDVERTEREQRNLQSEVDEREKSRKRLLDLQRQTQGPGGPQETLEIRQSIPPVKGGGLGATGNEEMLEHLKTIAANTDRLVQQWMTGAS